MPTRDDDQRRAFEAALEDDPTDLDTRQVFADWLEERGLDDEARAQREWDGDEEDEKDWAPDRCCVSDDEGDSDWDGCGHCRRGD